MLINFISISYHRKAAMYVYGQVSINETYEVQLLTFSSIFLTRKLFLRDLGYGKSQYLTRHLQLAVSEP